MGRRLIWGICGTTKWKLLGGKDHGVGEESTDQGTMARVNGAQAGGTMRTPGRGLRGKEGRTRDSQPKEVPVPEGRS